MDGRAHPIRFRGVEAFEHAPPFGGIIELRRFGGAADPRPMLVLANRSDLDLNQQIIAPGATWIDHRLVERDPMPLAMGGFGRETRDAMQARAEHLAGEGLARQQSQRIIMQRDLLNTLRRRELDAVGAKTLSQDGIAAHEGRDRRPCERHLSSTPDARLRPLRHDRQRSGFQLVPWSREIEKKFGQHVVGIAKDGGGIEWTL
jgi:Protein of unknown function (DUF3363)